MVGGALFVAGIGASAGGLEALQALISGLRANGRVAYVVAQHMADDAHSDLVVRLLGRDSALPVMLAEDGERLRADTIRFIPAGCDGLVREGRLYLERRSVANLSAPSVNVLFASVAQACSERAIGIVLSGAGSDGTVGCRAIKARGGQTFVQSPDEARCNGMPGSAIAGRLADRVLPAADIARAVMALFQPSGPGPAATPEGTPTVSSAEREELAVLLPLVRQATGVDFTHYKEETLLRRLAKRKSDLGVVSAGAYLTLVQRRPEELQALQQFFLVSVSSFFRDRASFACLARALAERVAAKPEGEAFRVWVPGCASGEEAYTLAIILAELAARHRGPRPIRVLASDINPSALATARAGLYKPAAVQEMATDLRQRYLQPRDELWEVGGNLRALVAFEERDVLSSTPDGPMDLISCRNLFIYLKSPLQDRLIRLFHGALAPGGLLFVGQAESLGTQGNSLFVPISQDHRLFRRRD